MQAEQQGPTDSAPGPSSQEAPVAAGWWQGGRRLLVVAIGIVLAAVVATGGYVVAAGSGGVPTVEPSEGADGPLPERQAIESILAGRARAVRDHDRTAFLATLGYSTPAFRASQEQVFDNLIRLPVTGWREELATTRPVVTTGGKSTLRLTLRYRLAGFDRYPVARTRYLTVARRPAAGWVIIDDGRPEGLADDTEIWENGRSTVVRGRSSLVIGDGKSSAALQEIARRLDAAVPVVTATVGDRWARRAVALVPADESQAERLVGNGQSLREIAALATVVPGAEDGSQGEDRVIISPATFAKLNPLGRQVVLTHELTHVATGGARDGTTPLWLIEGLADYVGYKSVKVSVPSAARELRRDVKAGRLPSDLPAQDDFGGGSVRLSQAYEEAWLACRMIAERYGEAALLKLYRTAGRQNLDTLHPDTTALRAVLGLSRPAFIAMWRDYMRKVLR